MSALVVSCPHFSGSLFDLARLVVRGEVDVYALILNDIVGQVVKAILDHASPCHTDEAGHLLATCASLIMHKSRRMLPAREDHESKELGCAEESEIILADGEVIRNNPYKEVLGAFEAMEAEAALLYPRGTHPSDARPPAVLQTSLMSLVLALQDLLSQATDPTLDISYDEYTLTEAISSLRDKFVPQSRWRIRDVFPPGTSRLKIVVLFLGLLELIRAGYIELSSCRDGELLLLAQGEWCVA